MSFERWKSESEFKSELIPPNSRLGTDSRLGKEAMGSTFIETEDSIPRIEVSSFVEGGIGSV